MTGFQIWSQNWVWIIFDSFLAEKQPKNRSNNNFGLFVLFFGQDMDQILSKLNSEATFEILSSMRTF